MEYQLDLLPIDAHKHIFVGEENGAMARKALALDNKDADPHTYAIALPDEVTAVNTSYYLGLFYPSIEKLGAEPFLAKYRLSLSAISDDELRAIIEENVRRCRIDAILEYSLRHN